MSGLKTKNWIEITYNVRKLLKPSKSDAEMDVKLLPCKSLKWEKKKHIVQISMRASVTIQVLSCNRKEMENERLKVHQSV